MLTVNPNSVDYIIREHQNILETIVLEINFSVLPSLVVSWLLFQVIKSLQLLSETGMKNLVSKMLFIIHY